MQNTPAAGHPVVAWQDDNTTDFVEVGDVIMFSPDAVSSASDRKNGYKLGVNIGQVISIDGEDLTVWWMWSGDESWEGARWIDHQQPTASLCPSLKAFEV